MSSPFRVGPCCVAVLCLVLGGMARAADPAVPVGTVPFVAPASDQARQAMRGFKLPQDWVVELIAAEPDLANPVAFTFDEQERIYVVETFRHGNGILDIRGRLGWPSPGFKRDLPAERRENLQDELLDADLACRTVEDRERMLQYYFAENASMLEAASDRVRLLFRDSDGQVTRSTVFATGFQTIVDGLAAGVLSRGGDVWFANIPHLWHLRDTDDDGVADERTSLQYGFGVRVGFLGHDLHGLCFGPDGRIYFSIGDRGASLVSREGRSIEVPDTGAVFRCDPDGSNLELFASGLRNPQELVFDALGNLWTGDNNSDGGDQARWVYLVEGGDSGWHIGWQFLESPHRRGPWNAEGMWRPEEASRIGYIVPPLANIGAGPSGITYGAGTGLPEEWNGRFFMVDFRGGPSGIWRIGVEPRGAGYAVSESEEVIWNALPTDVELGPDGGLYWTDWVQGWNTTGKGRIYRAYPPEILNDPRVRETRELLRADLTSRSADDLAGLLSHPDLRVRQRAQFALADRGAVAELRSVIMTSTNRFARLHGLWGVTQIARKDRSVAPNLLALLFDPDPEVRGQAAKSLGDLRYHAAGPDLDDLLADPEPRPRFFAAIALGHLKRREAASAVLGMIRAHRNKDPYLRHAGVMALVGTHTPEELRRLARDPSPAVRLSGVVALRRLASPYLADFLEDKDPGVLLETARAIHDLPVPEAIGRLARLIDRGNLPEPLLRRVLSANLRAGGRENAMALAAFAAHSNESPDARAEAVRMLGHFTRPPGRDQVTGLWRPLSERPVELARTALRGVFSSLLSGPEVVQAEAASAVARLGIGELTTDLEQLARDTKAGPSGRVSALRAMAKLNPEKFPVLLSDLAADENESVRRETLRWQGRLGRSEALGALRTALEKGGIAEKQVALASLGSIRDAAADEILVEWLQRARQRQVPQEVELELLEASQSRRSQIVRDALSEFQTSLGSITNGLPRHLLRGGDASEGSRIYHEKQEVQCARCHRIGGSGGLVGPDLKGIGSRQTREYLLEAIIRPNAVVAPGYENVTVETRDGEVWSGTVQAESATDLVLNTVDGGTMRIEKRNIVDRWKGLSSMPEGLADALSPRELRDLVEFLASLKE